MSLAVFTHFWNISQFPAFHVDEGHYIRRALHVLNGLGPQENQSNYDHPFMGQLILASFFKMIGYPDSLKPLTSIDSIEMLYTVPRIFMGLLFLIDTFLVFMITHYCYNKNIAFVTGILFAITPMSWQLRRVVLESIQLPFLLSSILLILIILKGTFSKTQIIRDILLLSSGILLSLAIFTKIPVFTLIPLILYMIIKFSNKIKKDNKYILRNFSIWFIPIILIPSIWPIYALIINEFDDWIDGVIGQTVERTRTLNIFEPFLKIDPLLFFIGLGGLILSLIRKDFFLILWILPFLIFVMINGWFASFHWILLFTPFCISSAIFLIELPKKIFRSKSRIKYIQISIVSVVVVFSFVSTFLIISLDLSDIQFEAAAISSSYIKNLISERNMTNNYLIITSPVYEWLFKYPFEFNNTINFRNIDTISSTTHVILIMDSPFRDFIKTPKELLPTKILTDNSSKTRIVGKNIGSWIKIDLGKERKVCEIEISWYKGDSRKYNFSISSFNDGLLSSSSSLYYSNGDTLKEKYTIKNMSGRYIQVDLFGNSENNIGSISELSIFGYIEEKLTSKDKCSSILTPNEITISKNSYIEADLDNRIEQIQKILLQTNLISTIKTEEKYTSYFPFTNLKYSSPGYVEIRIK